MNDRIAKLQLRIRALHRGHAASQVRYPADLRAEIIAVARAGQTAGGSVYRLAREIGVSAPTLIEWLRRPARGRLRQITVAPAPATTMGAPTNPVLVTPHGFRIEGLDLAGLVTVLRTSCDRFHAPSRRLRLPRAGRSAQGLRRPQRGGGERSRARPVPRQNLIRLAQEH